MPNSDCLQKGQVAGSETSSPSSPPSPVVAGTGGGAEGSVCSGGCGSGRLICTKHSEQIHWSQHLVLLPYLG